MISWNGAKNAVRQRLNDNVILTFIISLIILNWKPLYYLIFFNGDPDYKILYIEKVLSNDTLVNLGLAVAFTFIYGLIYPFILILFNIVKNKYLIKEEKNKTSLLNEIKNSNKAEFKAELARTGTNDIEDLEKRIKEKDKRIEELEDRIKGIQKSGQNTIKEYEGTIVELKTSNSVYTKRINDLEKDNNILNREISSIESVLKGKIRFIESIYIIVSNNYEQYIQILINEYIKISNRDIDQQNKFRDYLEDEELQLSLKAFVENEYSMGGIPKMYIDKIESIFGPATDYLNIHNFRKILFLIRLYWFKDMLEDLKKDIKKNDEIG